MPFKITNVTHQTIKKPSGVDITIAFDDNVGGKVRHVISPGQSIILYHKPISAHQLQIRNAVIIEEITQDAVIALNNPKPTSNVNTPTAIDSEEEIDENTQEDFIKSENTPKKKKNVKNDDNGEENG